VTSSNKCTSKYCVSLADSQPPDNGVITVTRRDSHVSVAQMDSHVSVAQMDSHVSVAQMDSHVSVAQMDSHVSVAQMDSHVSVHLNRREPLNLACRSLLQLQRGCPSQKGNHQLLLLG
jgi:hypothetical protein